MDTSKSALKKYSDIFNKYLPQIESLESKELLLEKINNHKKLLKIGLPDSSHENYKNTKLEDIYSNNYDFEYNPENTNANLSEFFKCSVEDMESHVVLLSNGAYYHKNKEITDLPEGVIVCGLADAKKKHKDIVNKYINKNVKNNDDGIVNLNTLLSYDGLFIYVPENTEVKKTIQLVNLTHGFGNKNIFKRNLFIVDKNSSLRLVVCDHTLNNSNNFVLDLTEGFVEESAKLEYYALQNEPNESAVINSLLVNQEKNSNFDSLALSLHGGLIRNNLYVKLAGEHAHTNLLGLFLADRKQRVDNYTHIEHAVPNCTSRELYKGLLDENASGSFTGKVLVQKDAQKTQAYQTNNNLCLTPNSKMATRPQLEIYADDVKCSHGATVGQLDENALFYLRARGIDYKEARLMLMFAFANDIIRNINIEALRKRISGLVNSRLRGEFSDCSHCLLNCSQGK